MEQIVSDYETADEANDLLQNGILVETNKGLVCMSLNDALSSDLNLSVEDLQSVATKLILQQNVPKSNKLILPTTATATTTTFNFDSDGFSSECSDASTTSMSSQQSNPTFVVKTDLGHRINGTKIVSIVPCTLQVAPQTVTVVESQPVNPPETKKQKGRGGWPKGRKRKPELLNLPPKAPATGYNLYLNEQRKLFKDTNLPFHEITKIVGNRWSNLSLDEKQPYLAKAEEDKRRYREELKQYRLSDAYRTYLMKKRRSRMQNNVLSESDMDATDEIDDEDNEELYCRTCDQWFHNLHNKREHLQGRQHTQTIAGEITRQLGNASKSAPNVSATVVSTPSKIITSDETLNTNVISDSMANLVMAVSKRESEIDVLKNRLNETLSMQNLLYQEFNQLTERHDYLKEYLIKLQEKEKDMETKVFNLWQVPSWLIISNVNEDSDAVNNILF